jgi:hypothetical protein
MLPVCCENSSCSELTARGTLAEHVLVCPETPVSCPHTSMGCTATPLRKSKDDHAAHCDFAIVPCESKGSGCQETLARGKLAEHNTACSFFRVPCQNEGCGKTFMRKDLAGHMERECDQRKLACTSGCSATMKACESRTHNCVAALRVAMTGLEGSLAASNRLLKETREAAHAELLARDEAIARLETQAREQGDKLEALVVLLNRALGEHHSLGKALNDPAGVLLAGRRVKAGPSAAAALGACANLGCEKLFALAGNHALSCRFHPVRACLELSFSFLLGFLLLLLLF